jgi:hypothetical protein
VRLLALLGLLLAMAVPALANGGTVRISSAPVGPWFVTVYSSPTPLRTGEVDISALVQDSADAVLDVTVAVHAEALDTVADAIIAPATRAQATNKLFKAAKFDIEVPGRWRFRVRVGGVDGVGGEVGFEADVVRRSILDRPLLMAFLVVLPIVVLARLLLGRRTESYPSTRI